MRRHLRAAIVLPLAFAATIVAASPRKHKASRPVPKTLPASEPLQLDDSKANPRSELDRILRDRPAPAAWTDTLLATPVDAIVRRNSPDTATPKSRSPLERLRDATAPWIGTRYRSGGNGEKGFDCSGFVNRVLGSFGVVLKGRSSPSYWTQGEAVDRDDLQPGDLVFFSDHTRRIGHVGIYLDEGAFVHASVQSGVIVSKLEETYYRKRYKGARRIPALRESLASPSVAGLDPREPGPVSVPGASWR